MHKNYFDIVMEHIEENVSKPTEEIKREIPNLIGRHSRAFNEHFNMLTGYTLDYYIKQRRLYYAARELAKSRNKTICDIALEYQFSDQSAFTRAIKAKYNVTPNEIRKEFLFAHEERFFFDDFTGKKADTDVARLIRSLEIDGPRCIEEFELMQEIEQMTDEYGFDVDTCYQIADLAEKLSVPITFFGSCCFNAVADYQSNPDYLAYEKEMAEIEFLSHSGIASWDEVEAMCAHYKCEYYELDNMKIYAYQKRVKQTD